MKIICWWGSILSHHNVKSFCRRTQDYWWWTCIARQHQEHSYVFPGLLSEGVQIVQMDSSFYLNCWSSFVSLWLKDFFRIATIWFTFYHQTSYKPWSPEFTPASSLLGLPPSPALSSQPRFVVPSYRGSTGGSNLNFTSTAIVSFKPLHCHHRPPLSQLERCNADITDNVLQMQIYIR